MRGVSPGIAADAGRGAAAASGAQRLMLERASQGRLIERLVQAVAAVISDAQRSAFEAWRAQREAAAGRSSQRDVTVWILTPAGVPESRHIDLGLVDDHFAEVLGDALEVGDKLVVRAREVARQ